MLAHRTLSVVERVGTDPFSTETLASAAGSLDKFSYPSRCTNSSPEAYTSIENTGGPDGYGAGPPVGEAS